MSRFQLSLNVTDVDASVDFYTKLFGVGPAKHRKGYANFVVPDPPLKLVVVADEGEPGTINHVGVEFATGDEVASNTERVAALGLPVEVDDPHTCCFATQEKAWTQDRDGVPWELYTVVADTTNFGASPRGGTPVDLKLPPVSLEELEAGLCSDEVIVIDAQGKGRFDESHLDGAIDFALDDVLVQASQHITDKDQRVLVYCSDAECLGAEFVGTQLIEAGYSNVGRYPAGIEGWFDSGRPTAATAEQAGPSQ